MEDNWIRFDPEDKLTWPEMEDEISGKTVLACDDEGHIYIAYLLNMIDKDPMWSLTNESEDLEVPAHCVVAWMPLPEPYDRSWEEPMGTWLFNHLGGDYTCSECGETFSDELLYISRSREPGLPRHCPGCGFPMKTEEDEQ